MMHFTPFFTTSVGMKPQSEAGSSSMGKSPGAAKTKFPPKDERHPSGKEGESKPNGTLTKKGADGMAAAAASIKGAFGGGSAPAPEPEAEAPSASLASSITSGLNKLRGG